MVKSDHQVQHGHANSSHGTYCFSSSMMTVIYIEFQELCSLVYFEVECLLYVSGNATDIL